MLVENKITNNTCNGNCSRCGECCGLFVPFNDKDIEIIKKYVEENNIKPQNRLNKMTGGFEARCCFYDIHNKKCLIYPVRPFACRDFICSRKDWKQRRDEYESRAKYNSTINEMVMATFDDKIYSDFGPIILYIVSMCRENNGLVDSEKLLSVIENVGRLDLLQYFTATDEKGNKIKGIDLE